MSSPSVVLDLGTFMCNIGFAGEEEPKISFHTEDVADGAFKNRVIVDLEKWKQLVSYCYKALNVEPSAQPLFLVDSTTFNLEKRKAVAKYLFEDLKIPSLFIASSFTYAGFLIQKTNCLIVDMGEAATEICAFCEDNVNRATLLRSAVTGRTISEYLARILNCNDHKTIWNVKSNLLECPHFAEIDAKMEEAVTNRVNYNGINFGPERVIASTAYLRPFFLEIDSDGLAVDIKEVIVKCPINFRKDMWTHVVLIGGSAQIKGFATALQEALVELAPEAVKPEVHVSVAEKPQIASWIGASAYAAAKPNAAVLKSDYDTEGEKIVQDHLMN
ncbi:Actin family protein [Trichomonas vaginalis G3]|uniref:Actin family protein n=1 Tax=Trichomonas vaginalis (strain ATCC PRA-98 / G3) TaxID=412133 RepID=A2F9B6_TRIV3|nr:ATP binding [Trichomonas vaginalis G3]EAX98488.1 Actin family protein [Trichomonas vaginalis G3]KAI5506718.1 ATP binding [Trichomonas vaginalis G3]|eukprot:XP_001311418.1 Actin family protein [Trichomonas vaginalis G3]